MGASLHPWTIGEQTLSILPPRPEGMPDSAEWNPLRLTFSRDPNDSSLKRLRIEPPDRGTDAIEVLLTGNGTIVRTLFQPRERKPWDHSLPAVQVGPDGKWHKTGEAGSLGAPLNKKEIAEYNRLARIYSQPTLEDGGATAMALAVEPDETPATADSDVGSTKDRKKGK